jgi:hypothetical protein
MDFSNDSKPPASKIKLVIVITKFAECKTRARRKRPSDSIHPDPICPSPPCHSRIPTRIPGLHFAYFATCEFGDGRVVSWESSSTPSPEDRD